MPEYQVIKGTCVDGEMIQRGPRPELNGHRIVELKDSSDVKDAVKAGFLKKVGKKKKD